MGPWEQSQGWTGGRGQGPWATGGLAAAEEKRCELLELV